MAGAELENCAFCAKQLIQANDRNLVDGRASFKAVDEISDLPLTVTFSSLLSTQLSDKVSFTVAQTQYF